MLSAVEEFRFTALGVVGNITFIMWQGTYLSFILVVAGDIKFTMFCCIRHGWGY
jgi:hypothetical protein